jgi:tRNA (guanine37-N1)-methyltransferase
MNNSSSTDLLHCVQVPIQQAESIKRELQKLGLFLNSYKILKDSLYVYFPIILSGTLPETWSIVQKEFIRLDPKFDYRISLKVILPPNVHEFIPSSFDRLDHLILVKLDPVIYEFRQKIGLELIKQFNVDAVYNKVSDVETTFRTVQWECIAGIDNPIAFQRIHGLRFKFDINKVYFNTRLSNEYLRIARLCQSGNNVIDMFAGVGPFSLLCASFQRLKVYAIDVNPAAIELLLENISLNNKYLKGTITPYCGDSQTIIKPLPKADIIIMNLPGHAIEFLTDAVSKLQSGGIIFLHQFVHLSSQEKQQPLTLQTNAMVSELTLIGKKIGQIDLSWQVTPNYLRDVSPSKSHIVWDIRNLSDQF